MSYTIHFNGCPEHLTINLSNKNFQWVAQSLGLPTNAEAWLPSAVLGSIQRFHKQTSGFYSDPDLTARIFEYLAPVSDQLTLTVLNHLSEGVSVIDAGCVDYSNLGSLSDPNSDANQLWSTLKHYVFLLKCMAKQAQKKGSPLYVS